MKHEQLARLQRIARIRSDLEMRRFSAFKQHVEAAQRQILAISDELQALYAAPGEFSVPQAIMINAMAQERSRALLRAEQELQKMLPGFEAARSKAAREFGRVEVLGELYRHGSN